jgi:hypothetical protein
MSYVRRVILVGFTAEIVLLVIIHGVGDANLTNFGPAILAFAAVALGLILALACLIVGITLLFHRHWSAAGCYLLACTAGALLIKWALFSK